MSTFPRPWNHSLELYDVWKDEDRSFEERRDVIVERIKAMPLYVEDHEHEDFDDELWWIVDEMGDTDTEDYFNICWDAFYDWADDMRVWVNIHSPAKERVSG